MNIAIDGPLAAGKGTVARLVAKKLGLLYIDTGAMYRAISVFCDWHGVAKSDEPAVCRLLKEKTPAIELRSPTEREQDGRLCTVVLEGKDVSWEIRSDESDRGASLVGRYRCVRDSLLGPQRSLAQSGGVVMEGRDIGSFVLPNADCKIFLSGKEEVRARRRQRELISRGVSVPYAQVLRELRARDVQDTTRPLRPLVKAEGAIEIDTSEMTIDEVVDRVIEFATRHDRGHE